VHAFAFVLPAAPPADRAVTRPAAAAASPAAAPSLPAPDLAGLHADVLAGRAAAGESAALAALVARYHPRALRFAVNMGLAREDAEEAVQDAFVRVAGALPRFREGAPFEPWLFRILANRCRTARARARAMAPAAPTRPRSTTSPPPGATPCPARKPRTAARACSPRWTGSPPSSARRSCSSTSRSWTTRDGRRDGRRGERAQDAGQAGVRRVALGVGGGRAVSGERDEPLGAPLDAAAAALRAVPDVAPDALARATAAALAAHGAARAGAPARPRAARPWRAAGLAALAAGVLLAVGVWGGRSRGVGARPASSADVATGAPRRAGPAVPASATTAALDDTPRLVRFRLDAPGARRVTVVGDFNRWDPAATPLTPASGGWAADVALAPGRHAYAFVVDGRRVLDPAVPPERDPDFGGAHSVTVVGVAEAP
jgi:RNA polymerase sigma factor (sigma-70 family)